MRCLLYLLFLCSISFHSPSTLGEVQSHPNSVREIYVEHLTEYARDLCPDAPFTSLYRQKDARNLPVVKTLAEKCIRQKGHLKNGPAVSTVGRSSYSAQSANDVDTSVPTFHAISINRQSINVTNNSITVEVTLTLFDEGSEVEYAGLYFDAPEGVPSSQSKDLWFHEWQAGEVENTYQSTQTVVFDGTDPEGIWSARIWLMKDTSANETMNWVTADKMEELGFDPYIQIENDNEVDLTPPEFREISINRKTINVTNDTVSVEVTVTVFDEGSDVDYTGVYLDPPTGVPGTHRKYAWFYDWQAGEAPNTYQSTETVTFDKTDAQGLWSARVYSMTDTNNNTVYEVLTASEIEEMGFDPYLQVENDNQIDLTPPAFHALSINRKNINVTNDAVTVEVTLTLFDEGSDIQYAYISMDTPEGATSYQSKNLWFYHWKQGNLPNTYTATEALTFYPSETEGTWSARVWGMYDSSNNETHDGATTLEILRAGSNPYLTVLNGLQKPLSDSSVSSEVDWLKVTTSQTSEFELMIEASQEYQIDVLANEGIRLDELNLIGASAISKSCQISTTIMSCTFTAAGFQDKLTAEVRSVSSDPLDYGLSISLKPKAHLEVDWSNNFVNVPVADLDDDGLPNSEDNDLDGDGVENSLDLYPFSILEALDSDSDGTGDNADTDDDNDGLPDEFEQAFGLDPLDSTDWYLDIDSDGLSNLQEYEFGTRPDLADTDGDGYSDYKELLKNSDPLASTSVPRSQLIMSWVPLLLSEKAPVKASSNVAEQEVYPEVYYRPGKGSFLSTGETGVVEIYPGIQVQSN